MVDLTTRGSSRNSALTRQKTELDRLNIPPSAGLRLPIQRGASFSK
jgi:hypothetical protein